MGKLVKLENHRKKRDKKYNPYKTNPLNKQLTKVLEGKDKEFRDAIVTNEEGEIQLDAAGKPVFKDSISWETDGPQIMAIWSAIKALLEENLVPPMEVDAAHDLMMTYAKEHRDTNKKYTISIPLNYFVGTWHVLNTCRKFHIFKNDEKLDKAIDGLTMWFAKQIDIYHEVKRRERIEDEAKPNEVLALPKGDYYKPIDKVSQTDNTKSIEE